MKPTIFVSHVSEEQELALALKTRISADFLGLVEIFVSSDGQTIEAGSDWLTAVRKGLESACILVVLCSPVSVKRPWVNFEVGAAWIRGITIVPVCHSGTRVSQLPMPYLVLNGIEAASKAGLRMLYAIVAKHVGCAIPQTDFAPLHSAIVEFESKYADMPQVAEARRDNRPARERIYSALRDPRYTWRSIERLSALSGMAEDEVLELLVSDPKIRIGVGKKHRKRIARMESRE
jgi:hypothetical protein